MATPHVDVLIVGAGISGIAAAYYLQTRCPEKRFTILESRERLGGTWDLFRYPGIRSDSDMFTLGYSFRPWTGEKTIADGGAIRNYLHETASAFGIDKAIAYGVRVEAANFSSTRSLWEVTVRDVATGECRHYTCNFMFLCVGYYRYEEGYTPKFPGIENFNGEVVHPQKWRDDVVYANKRVVVIGSGATAMTLVPALAGSAAHVTMLQRSPTYVISLPAVDPVTRMVYRYLPQRQAYALTRWRNIAVTSLSYQLARRFPNRMREVLLKHVRRLSRGKVDVDTHFTPRYDPWDQRLCVVPNSDLFKALRAGTVSMCTDHIERFTATGIALRSGKHLEADLVVTATGLQMQFAGGIKLSVDGTHVEVPKLLIYKGMMASDLPNMAYAMGYTNASWTLRVEIVCAYLCRLLNHMQRQGYTQFCPRQRDPSVVPEPFAPLTSGYFQRVKDRLPRSGSKRPWKVYQNYIVDYLLLRNAKLEDGVMEFRRVPTVVHTSSSASHEVA